VQSHLASDNSPCVSLRMCHCKTFPTSRVNPGLWNRKRLALDPFDQLPKIKNESADPYFLGMMKGWHCSSWVFFLSTPSSHKWAFSFLNCFSLAFGMEEALAWHGLTPYLSSMLSSSPNQVPKLPSNRSLNFSKGLAILAFLWHLSVYKLSLFHLEWQVHFSIIWCAWLHRKFNLPEAKVHLQWIYWDLSLE